jgi:hypothetical protein
LLLFGCKKNPGIGAHSTVNDTTEKREYSVLLAQFPVADQGLAVDVGCADKREYPAIYALLLSSEAMRWKSWYNGESRRRIRSAVSWLLKNADLDSDELPGWGLPYSNPSIADGSEAENRENFPYTITTEQVLEALLDGLEKAPGCFSHHEASIIEAEIKKTWIGWCRTCWVDDDDGSGWFAYSPSPAEKRYLPNVNGMMLGLASRIVGHKWLDLDCSITQDASDKAKAIVKKLVASAIVIDGLPYWPYMPKEKLSTQTEYINDGIHHIFTLWGIEEARDNNILPSDFPFSRREALSTLAVFEKEGCFFDYPIGTSFNDESYQRPMRLWSMGGFLAFLGKYDDPANKLWGKCFMYLNEEYGECPNLHVYPDGFSSNTNFYPRHAAFVLWGIAEKEFGRYIEK